MVLKPDKTVVQEYFRINNKLAVIAVLFGVTTIQYSSEQSMSHGILTGQAEFQIGAIIYSTIEPKTEAHVVQAP